MVVVVVVAVVVAVVVVADPPTVTSRPPPKVLVPNPKSFMRNKSFSRLTEVAPPQFTAGS